ncbi:14-3-3 Protein Eta [Manis pentadactyla]|nr:14-3-3 Protein Eta [Manis pentadactyla]
MKGDEYRYLARLALVTRSTLWMPVSACPEAVDISKELHQQPHRLGLARTFLSPTTRSPTIWIKNGVLFSMGKVWNGKCRKKAKYWNTDDEFPQSACLVFDHYFRTNASAAKARDNAFLPNQTKSPIADRYMSMLQSLCAYLLINPFPSRVLMSGLDLQVLLELMEPDQFSCHVCLDGFPSHWEERTIGLDYQYLERTAWQSGIAHQDRQTAVGSYPSPATFQLMGPGKTTPASGRARSALTLPKQCSGAPGPAAGGAATDGEARGAWPRGSRSVTDICLLQDHARELGAR